MAVFKTIEEEVVRTLITDANIKTIITTDIIKRIFIDFTRPQTKKFPMISVGVNYGPQEPAIHAMNGICTITMEFKELQSGGSGKPTKYSKLSLLKQHIIDALSKKSFGTNLVINKFLLLSGSVPFFDTTDKVWRWPLVFDFVHEDDVVKGRVGVEIP